jgi:hypothetical protein
MLRSPLDPGKLTAAAGATAFLAAGPGIATLAEAIPISGAPRTTKETQMNIPVPEIAMADLRKGMSRQ